MYGTLTIARFSFLEILKSKVFKVLLIVPIVINIIFCGVGYWGMTHASEFEHEIRQEFRHSDVSFEERMFDTTKDQLIKTYIGTFLASFIIYPMYIFFGNLLVIFSAVGLMSPELERRSIYTLISKPISRTMIFAGKYLGVVVAQLSYAIILILITQVLLLASGAGFFGGLFPAFAVGFIAFLIFAAVALLFSTWFRPIPASVMSLIILSASSNAGTSMGEAICKEIFKFGKWVDYVILLLPQQRLIGRLANNFNLDKYQKMFLSEMPDEFEEVGFLKFVSDDFTTLSQPLIWFIIILIIAFTYFSRKEFD